MKALGIRWTIMIVALAAAPAAWPRSRARERNRGSLCARRHAGRGRNMRAWPKADDPERGDVPGWVMITLMSAVLVAALLALAGPALEAMFNQAMDTVSK